MDSITMHWGFDQFIQRWLAKAGGYDDTSLDAVFDKFVTLYIIFNALYEEAFSRMLDKNSPNAGKAKEHKKAVCYIACFLGHEELSRKLRTHTEAISQIQDILENKKYYFHVIKGSSEPNWARDQDMLRCLKSTVPIRFSEAVLALLYRTRCNLFHGAKGYDSEQENVLRSMSELLEEVNNMILNKLSIVSPS